ncbi:hypothetical protein V9T40_003403 [Parthenolecanium corni]|uniref:Uncharacterized protein n=1 Tax=Parthenolecanium corni TaxID=536013 RepID=A0AAN9U119_9HEMI
MYSPSLSLHHGADKERPYRSVKSAPNLHHMPATAQRRLSPRASHALQMVPLPCTRRPQSGTVSGSALAKCSQMMYLSNDTLPKLLT